MIFDKPDSLPLRIFFPSYSLGGDLKNWVKYMLVMRRRTLGMGPERYLINQSHLLVLSLLACVSPIDELFSYFSFLDQPPESPLSLWSSIR